MPAHLQSDVNDSHGTASRSAVHYLILSAITCSLAIHGVYKAGLPSVLLLRHPKRLHQCAASMVVVPLQGAEEDGDKAASHHSRQLTLGELALGTHDLRQNVDARRVEKCPSREEHAQRYGRLREESSS